MDFNRQGSFTSSSIGTNWKQNIKLLQRPDTMKSHHQRQIKIQQDLKREYKKRLDQQTISWINGKPYHNKIDNECTPDFSCCNPSLLANSGERMLFLEAINKNNTVSRDKMLTVFMDRLAKLHKMPEPVYIILPDNK